VDESERRYGRAKLLFKEETDGGIKALESKFYHSPSLATALQIARYYYNKGDYKNAIKWAMRANSLDKRNEESWLLFAKALAKSGKRGRAISVLEIYAKQSGSHEALRLIEKIRAGVVE
jgi:tetratricopeptide (TPR) repeat protein